MLDELVSNELKRDNEVVDIPQDTVEKLVQALLRLRRKYDDELHNEELKVFEELAESLFELRLEKVIEGIEPKGFDKEVLSVINVMKKVYVGYLTGNYYTHKGNVLCLVNKKAILDDVQLEPGDVVILPLNKVLALITTDYITPIEVKE
ncbi:hypothetical protein [Stygiolobus caldivivus]|uniref:Uncharacterized protein n=1 Tax=Stygiolobus caldivivus TaxID=2824673 RepID=A0A8D5U7H2_9CREN|nr:hypothetical protein [Stygiolobus caldivivus]BCU70236.1 hypothetical protein KN1_15330 [Stygiolobus caldivivus]